MSRPISRKRSNSGRLATAALRRAMNCGLLNARAFCRPASARALRAFCLNWGEVASMRLLLIHSLSVREREWKKGPAYLLRLELRRAAGFFAAGAAPDDRVLRAGFSAAAA